MTPARAMVIGRLADHCAASRPEHTLRVAVDGITAAGKTTFAHDLAQALTARGVPVVRVSMDGFHHPRAVRHRLGRDSAVGYYWEAYDFSVFAGSVLHPLGPHGDGEYWPAVIDLATDRPVDDPPQKAPEGAVLIVDGSFLQRGDLRGLWDETIYLDVGMDIAMARGSRRDATALGGLAAAEKMYFSRYHAACQIYIEESDPLGQATAIVVHDNPDQPHLQRIGGSAGQLVDLFAYGTLQQPDVQATRIGRHLRGHPGTLPGYWLDWITTIDPGAIATSGSDCHPIARSRTRATPESVEGTIFRLTSTELAAADRHEAKEYRRALVRLSSGAEVWAYLASDEPSVDRRAS